MLAAEHCVQHYALCARNQLRLGRTGYWQQSTVYSITPLLHTGAPRTQALSATLLTKQDAKATALQISQLQPNMHEWWT